MLDVGRLPISRWVLAALVVLGVHAGAVALTFMHWEEEEADDIGGAVVIELAPIAAVAPVDTPDMERGPVLTEEVAPSAQSSTEIKQDTPKEMPKVEPSPAPEPEVALPAPRPEQKEEPEEEQNEEAVAEQLNQNEQQAPMVAMAPPRVEAEPSPNAAPSQGRAASEARAQATWQKSLLKHLDRHKRYPTAARNNRVEGTVVVAFKISQNGNVTASHVVKSSGSSLLDEEALDVLRRADPVPEPPSHINGSALDLVLPIQFKIR